MRKALFTLAVVASLATASAANATTGSGTAVVTGSVLGTITVAATGGTLPNLVPGQTVSTAAPDNVIVTDTNGGWTLSAGDASSTTPGQMDKTGAGACTTSEASLQNPIHLSAGTATSVLGGPFVPTANAGDFALPALASAFAIGTLNNNQAGAAGTATVPITYSQKVDPGEQVNALCVYSITTTYSVTGA